MTFIIRSNEENVVAYSIYPMFLLVSNLLANQSILRLWRMEGKKGSSTNHRVNAIYTLTPFIYLFMYLYRFKYKGIATIITSTRGGRGGNQSTLNTVMLVHKYFGKFKSVQNENDATNQIVYYTPIKFLWCRLFEVKPKCYFLIIS